MKLPEECLNINEIRDSIDKIDSDIISLLGKRFLYVKEIIKYKEPDKDSIIAINRYNEVLSHRRKLAEDNGISADIVEEVYKLLIDYFIKEELELLNKLSSKNKNNV